MGLTSSQSPFKSIRTVEVPILRHNAGERQKLSREPPSNEFPHSLRTKLPSAAVGAMVAFGKKQIIVLPIGGKCT